jgi:hypothetical protein
MKIESKQIPLRKRNIFIVWEGKENKPNSYSS